MSDVSNRLKRKDDKVRKILVTGGAGNIGSALSKKLIENQDNYVVIVDNLSTGSISKLPSKKDDNWVFVHCDVNVHQSISEIMLAHKFDYVFHYAAVVGVQRTQLNPINVLADIKGIESVLNLAKNTSVKRVFFASSSEVYGEPIELPQNEETTPLNSKLPYAIVKNLGEAYFRSFKKFYNLDYTIFRFFNTYGPNQSTDFVMKKFIDQALRGDNITIYGNGMQSRTFCYVEDNVDACVKVFDENLALNDVINIGSSDEISILDLAKLIIKVSNSNSKIIHLPPLKEGDMTRRCPDNSKMKSILNRPLVPLEDGIKKLIELY
ncbi:NAD-dependent epimerase/dehydratase family protein [Cycloclasticus pugetii]|jgi:nucleoside-diphosphate-sugar epimerase|uniref:NAD-dependent epimerase/dehydratase family protein n=1 Tax=Cycloclasticus pugetii TaxID=34068 RepID=UPI000924A0D7|nr:NAD-dependent epimerase/dehydratase family protein [Cycloclasticus pugetii]SHJ40000.1 UDP-glucose 4-epimerase [Cycloclasticus pugetii]